MKRHIVSVHEDLKDGLTPLHFAVENGHSIHNDKSPYQCDKCEIKLNVIKNLNSHRNSDHRFLKNRFPEYL